MTICNTFCTNKTSANFKDNQLWDCNFLCIKTGTLGSLSCLAWESAIVHSYIPDKKDIFIYMQHQEKGLVKYVYLGHQLLLGIKLETFVVEFHTKQPKMNFQS